MLVQATPAALIMVFFSVPDRPPQSQLCCCCCCCRRPAVNAEIAALIAKTGQGLPVIVHHVRPADGRQRMAVLDLLRKRSLRTCSRATRRSATKRLACSGTPQQKRGKFRKEVVHRWSPDGASTKSTCYKRRGNIARTVSLLTVLARLNAWNTTYTLHR